MRLNLFLLFCRIMIAQSTSIKCHPMFKINWIGNYSIIIKIITLTTFKRTDLIFEIIAIAC